MWLVFILSFIFLPALKEIRNAFDLFKLTPEEKSDFPENNRKREEIPLDCKITEDHKTKENKQLLKERRNTRDETDTWAYIAAEGDQEILDSMCQADENSGMFVVILQYSFRVNAPYYLNFLTLLPQYNFDEKKKME